MASSTVAWMPSRGRHQINIGPSLGRAIKARKLKGSPAPTTKRSNLPERDFYAFRYNFKPGAIDSTKPASIEVKKTLENTQITAEFPSKEMSEVCTYNGTEIPAKEVECIIIYDEETGQYTLEKLDSVVSLQFGGKRTATTPAAPSPATEPSTSSTPLANTKGKAKQIEDDDELEQLLLAGEDNTDPKRITTMDQRREEEEEEEGEEIDIPLRLQISKRPPPSTSIPNHTTKSAPNTKAANTSQLPPSSSILTKSSTTHAASSSKTDNKPTKMSSSTLPAPKPPKSALKQPKKTKAPHPQTADTSAYADEEIIEIERPAKKPRISTTTTSRQSQAVEPLKPKPPVELSLPGGQSTFVAPLAPTGSIPPKKATNIDTPTIPMTVPPGVSANITMEEVLGDEEEEDEDEDWEAVPTSAPHVQAAPSQHEYDRLEDEIFGPGFGEDEEEQEIDVNAFEAELNEQMEKMEEDGEDDDDMEDVMQEAAASAARPISLNRLASGIAAGESDEDYSSSDTESD